MPKYYEISEAAAKRTKEMNSYSDYAPGSATAGYQQKLLQVLQDEKAD